MIASKEKNQDRETRILVMEHMAVAMRMYARSKNSKYLAIAKEFGETAKMLNERIKNNKYSQ